MAELEIVYQLRRRIDRLDNKLKTLTYRNVHGNTEINQRTVARINKLEARITLLKGIHTDQINRIYSGLDKRPRIVPSNFDKLMKITEMDIGDNVTRVKMVPSSFKLDDRKGALKDIIYPTDGTDRNLINLIARYRTMVNQSKDFSRQPLEINEKSRETVIIALDAFVRRFGGELAFTNTELSFSECAEKTACGIGNLGSVHLLVGNFIPTAKFSLKLNINYDRDLASSTTVMKNFIRDFNRSIVHLLRCAMEFVRIFSIEKVDQRTGMIKVNFGLTTSKRNQTVSLARQLQTSLRRSDFPNDKILQLVQADRYDYELSSILTYLQLSSKDFNSDYNHDLTFKGLGKEDRRGNYPYYRPIGWFRHGLNVSEKYSNDDQLWLGHRNSDGEWPVAFHGTRSEAVSGSIQHGLLANLVKRDMKQEEAIEQMGNTVAKPGLYVSTHSDDDYTTPFTVTNGDRNETFRMLFQCRIKPNSFTTDTGVTTVGEAWRIIDSQAIRPYGLLIKKENIT